MLLSNANFAVCLAHPGHELLIHGWLRREQPLVFILTDGSGFEGQSRLEYSRRLLAQIGVPMAEGCGRLTDKQAYQLLLQGRVDLLTKVVEELATELQRRDVHAVVADAAEGYNPVHDLSRLIAGAAATLARVSSIAVAQYELPIADQPSRRAADAAIRCELSDRELDAKITAARGYLPLQDEVDGHLAADRRESLRTETMYRVEDWRSLPAAAQSPRYETFGEQRVGKGRYHTVIRYAEHVQRLHRELLAWVDEQGALVHRQRTRRQSARGASTRP